MANKDWEAALLSKIDEAGLPTPVREFRFHPVRKWRFDFAYPDMKLAIEVEGGTYGRLVYCQACGALVVHKTKTGKRIPVRIGGGHNTAQGYEEDTEKYNAAKLLGWHVLRFTPKAIRTGDAVKTILEMVVELGKEKTNE